MFLYQKLHLFETAPVYSNLRYLGLRCCSLSDASSLGKLVAWAAPNLEALDVSYNELRGIQCINFGGSFFDLTFVFDQLRLSR